MKKLLVLFVSIIMAIGLLGCSSEDISLNFAEKTSSVAGNIYDKPESNEYDSADTAIVTAISTQRKAITFYNLDLRKTYTLNYDSSTRFADSYNTAMSASQIKPGTLVDVLFLKSGKKLISLTGSSDCFVMSDVTGFSIDSHGVFKYKSENYEITDSTILISKEGDMDLSDLCDIDSVTLVGKDTTLYSIIVDRGHGYLSLSQHENFIGGYLEISAKQIEKISDKMLLTIPEGSYTVKIQKNSVVAEKQIEIVANSETVLSLGDIELPETKVGKVIFETTPSTAVIYIDGKRMDANVPLELGYGRHQLTAEADGYETLTRYFKVAEEMATLPVVMEKNSDTDKEETEDTSGSESATEGYFIFVNSPSDVEVYLDNYYIGMAPVMVVKEAGTHLITLKKAGYVTRSYNIMVQDEAGDLTYAFDDLLPSTTTSGEEETDPS